MTEKIKKAPLVSSAYRRLRQRAERDQISMAALDDLLGRLQAHPDLLALPQICRNLLRILEAAQQSWGEAVLSACGLPAWLPVLRWVSEHPQYFDPNVGSPKRNKSQTKSTEFLPKNQLAGKAFLRYPLYSTCYNSHSDPARQAHYRLLQAHLLIAQLMLLEKTRPPAEPGQAEEPSAIIAPLLYRTSLLVRRLSQSHPTRGTYLDQLPVESVPEVFAQRLAQTPRPSYDDQLLRWHERLTTFFENLYKDGVQSREPVRIRRGKQGGSRSIPGHFEITPQILQTAAPLGDPEDPDFDWAEHVCLLYLALTPEQQEDLLLADEDPTEDEQATSVHVFDFGAPGKAVGLGNFAAAARSQLQQRAKANQMPPWAYGILTAQEVRALIRGAIAWFQAAPGWRERQERREMLACLFVMLATGSSLQRTLSLRVFPAAQSKNAEFALLTAPEGATWRFSALVPQYASVYQPTAAEVRPSAYVFLPDRSGSSRWVQQHLQKGSRSAPADTGTVFGRDAEWYRRKLRELLSHPAANPTGRVTEAKIAQYLFFRVLRASRGDIAAAALVTGQAHLLARVRLYYASPSLARLQELYRKAVHEGPIPLVRGTGPTSPTASPLLPFDEEQLHVGSRYCPTFPAVQDAVGRLRQEVRCFAPRRHTFDLRNYHNRYTLYSLWYFGFATGIRGVVDPFLDRDVIHPKTGLTLLADKGPASGYKTRVAWIPEGVQEQIGNYQRHLKAVRCLLPSTASFDGSCFFLGPDLQAVAVHPRTLMEQMQPLLALPANFPRRFVRNQLLAGEWPPELVDAWMGHWFAGEEPWGLYSSFSYLRYRRQLQQQIEPLLDRLGFRPMRSSLK